MARDRTCKTISFNKQDPFERQLLKHSLQYKGFSLYIKRLIQRDMEGGLVQQQVPQCPMPPVEVNSKSVANGKPKMLGFV